jgi:hypothetical protein
MPELNSPFYKTLKILKVLGGEVEFKKVLGRSDVTEDVLKVILNVGFWGLGDKNDGCLWIVESDFSVVSINGYGEHILQNCDESVFKPYDDKLAEKIKELGINYKAKTPQKITIKTNLDNIEPQFTDDEPVINPALSYIDGTVFLTQKMPISVATADKAGIKQTATFDIPCIIYSNELRRGMITIDKKAMTDMKCDGVRLKNMPMIINNRWSLNSMRKFLENMANPRDVNFQVVFDDVKRQYDEYMEFTEDWHYDLMTVWCMGTYFHEIFNAYPYIFLNAVKRSGKTKCLALTGCMAFNAFNALTMTPASLFRLVDGTKATLLIDEMEKINKKDEGDLRALLLAGYKKGSEVPRVEEKKGQTGLKGYGVPSYSTYSPRMLANISGIEDVLEDRALTVILQRGNNKDKMNKDIDEHNQRWQEIRDKLYLNLMFYANGVNDRNENIIEFMDEFYAKNRGFIEEELNEKVVIEEKEEKQSTLWKGVGKIERGVEIELKDVIDGLIKGRGFELWRPIFTIASLVSEEVLLRIFINAVRHEKTRREEDLTETLDSLLIELLLQTVNEDNYYRVKDITQKLKEGNPDDERWLNQRWVSRALKRLGLIKERKKHSSGLMVKILVNDVKTVAGKVGITLTEAVNILKKPEKKSQNEEILNMIEKLGENGGEILENDLINKLKFIGVSNAEQRVNQLKGMGILFNPTPNVLKKV